METKYKNWEERGNWAEALERVKRTRKKTLYYVRLGPKEGWMFSVVKLIIYYFKTQKNNNWFD